MLRIITFIMSAYAALRVSEAHAAGLPSSRARRSPRQFPLFLRPRTVVQPVTIGATAASGGRAAGGRPAAASSPPVSPASSSQDTSLSSSSSDDVDSGSDSFRSYRGWSSKYGLPPSELERTIDHDNYARVRPGNDKLIASYAGSLDASRFAERAAWIKFVETAASNCYQEHECIRDSCKAALGDTQKLASLKNRYIRDAGRLHVNMFSELFSAEVDLDTFTCLICEKKKSKGAKVDPILLCPMSVGLYPSSSDPRLCASNDNTTWFSLSLVNFSKYMVLHAGVSFARTFEGFKG